jgi:hypothetical protein
VFVTLGYLSSRQLGVARELSILWLSSKKFVLPFSVCGLIVKNWIDLGGHSESPVLCGHLNRDVGIFVVLNFENKSCVLCAHIALLSKFMFLLS